jgi:acyl-coenzyme A synthetase/AMP-(fatty) acid ligase
MRRPGRLKQRSAGHPRHFDLRSLRMPGSVGEPINLAAWERYHLDVVADATLSSTPGGRPGPAAT